MLPAWQRLKDITGHARGRQAFGGTRQLTCRRLMPRGSLVVAADGKHHVTHPMWSIGRAAALRHPPRVRLSNACRNRVGGSSPSEMGYFTLNTRISAYFSCITHVLRTYWHTTLIRSKYALIHSY